MSKYSELGSALLSSGAVKGYVVAAADGQPLAGEWVGDQDAAASAAVLGMMQMRKLENAIGAANLKYLAFTSAGRQDLLLFGLAGDVLAVIKEKQGSVSEVAARVHTIIGEIK